jgi:hypothetical protein
LAVRPQEAGGFSDVRGPSLVEGKSLAEIDGHIALGGHSFCAVPRCCLADRSDQVNMTAGQNAFVALCGEMWTAADRHPGADCGHLSRPIRPHRRARQLRGRRDRARSGTLTKFLDPFSNFLMCRESRGSANPCKKLATSLPAAPNCYGGICRLYRSASHRVFLCKASTVGVWLSGAAYGQRHRIFL